ncbi:MAG: hypothetical protein K6F25_08605 [Bacteroidales bacterium]|nr:hypothetical protein [Bacteroidales bacterium]
MKNALAPALMALMLSVPMTAQEWSPSEWPVLKHYDKDHLYQVALPLGGIGTGTVSLGGRGELRDWEIMNIPGKGFNSGSQKNQAPFFAIFTQDSEGKTTATMLAGPLYPQEYWDASGCPADNYGLPRFRDASFDAAYPFGQVHLSDRVIPVEVTVKGFNPLVPTDADASGMPVAVLSYKVRNLSAGPLEVSVCGSLRNFIGRDGVDDATDRNVNEFRSAGGLKGIYFRSEGVPSDHPAWGTMALTTQADAGVSFRTSSSGDKWSNTLLNFWDDFSVDGMLTEHSPSGEKDPFASLAVKKTIAPGESGDFTFFLTWSFPNRKAWADEIVGNYYCNDYTDGWTAAEKIVPLIPDLEKKTLRFVEALLDCTYPDVVKEAALFNLSVLRSQTVFRLPDGHLMGWEGTYNDHGLCFGTCTHVWNYEVATPFLFGELARTMRDVEFNYALKDDGMMSFRAALPLSVASGGTRYGAADGQMGCIMKIYREWQLRGDRQFLEAYWPRVKKALSYAWVEKGWDGNQDGIMEGDQHNTMDVSYFGPNPQMGFWYIGALRAAEKMATAMKDREFAKKCKALADNGSKWMDENLFNGEYYEHRITDPATFEYLDMSDPDVKVPDYQLGRGCLVDQLVGQYMAHICGLGYLGDEAHIKKTLESIMKNNFMENVSYHFNNMRSYVLGDEAALLMAAWPHGRLKVPFPYFPEAMTGFEYCAAVGMLYEGQTENGLKCIKAIRDRFDGAKRNPFNEPECGFHYARSMASWAAIIALSRFNYSAVDRTISFTSEPGRYFWSTGYAYGTCEITDKNITIKVIDGQIWFDRIKLQGKKDIKAKVSLGSIFGSYSHDI